MKWQRAHVHPRAREIYPQSFHVLQSFIIQNPGLEFFEIGAAPSGLKGVQAKCRTSLEDTIRLMATCECFIGIDSGPMHLAIALGLKVVTIINFPVPDDICLPVLKPVHRVLYREGSDERSTSSSTGEIVDWLYPQSVLLHQDGEGGPHVKQLTLTNLSRAVSGEVYPYWSNAYLDLIFEKA